MANNILSASIVHKTNLAQLTSAILNGTTYTPPSPFILNAGNTQAIEDWLNSLVLNPVFSVVYIEGTNTSTIYFITVCTDLFDEQGVGNELVYTDSSGAHAAEFTFNDCGSTDCLVREHVYAMFVGTCDYTLDMQFDDEAIGLINIHGATITQFNYWDPISETLTNVLINPISATDFSDLTDKLISALGWMGWSGAMLDSGSVTANYPNSYLIWPYPTVFTDPVFVVTYSNGVITIPLDFQAARGSCENVSITELPTLFPFSSAELTVNHVDHIYDLVTGIDNFIEQLGFVSFNPWETIESGTVFAVTSPYAHDDAFKVNDNYWSSQSGFPEELYNFNPDVLIQISESGGQDVALVVVKGTVTPDCETPSCILFADTTGIYNGSDNDTGYGQPNFPGVTNIVSTSFSIYDNNGDIIGVEHDFGYLPDGLGNQACLDLNGFLTGLRLTSGALYTLHYKVTTDVFGGGTVLDCLEIPFIYPSCGSEVLDCLIARSKAALDDCPTCDFDKEFDKVAKLWIEYDIISITQKTNPECTAGDFDALLKKCLKDCGSC